MSFDLRIPDTADQMQNAFFLLLGQVLMLVSAFMLWPGLLKQKRSPSS